MDLSKIKPYEKNAKKHPKKQIEQVANSITKFGFNQPIVVDKQGTIIVGHGRYEASKLLGLVDVPVIKVNLTEEEAKAYRLADNKLNESEWDMGLVIEELKGLSEEMIDLTGFDKDLIIESDEKDDEVPEIPEEPKSKIGDLYELGRHRLLCGDATKIEDVERLMDGKKADMAHNDPPYGMKKEKEGVLNDNLNFDNLLKFNQDWIGLQFTYLKDNGSFYCWGTDEPLMDIYSNILKPYIKTQKATFRNLITWNKGNGQGQNAEEFRMYPIADEKCLFVMCGVQGFNNNADNYFEGWEPVRDYLLGERKKAGWDIPTMKRIAGHSDLNRDHWTSKSQFNLPTKEVYQKFQSYCQQNNINAFKKEYDELKKEYYSTRAYFDNTHDNQNNVWHFERATGDERQGNHATPKPLQLCERVIKSSCPENGLVIDFFGGSGSTLIACEKTNRICYMSELDPKYIDVIVQRYVDYTGNESIKLNGEEIIWKKK